MSDSKKDPDAIAARVMADSNTAVIAESLGIAVEDYVAQVVHYVMHPNQPAQIMVMSDANLKARGHTPADPKDISAFITQSATIAGAGGSKSGFTPTFKPMVSLDQVRVGEGVDTAGADPKLKEDLAEQLRRNRSKKG